MNFHESDIKVVVSPYRVAPLGAHIDHQGGDVLGMAINAGSFLAFVPNSSNVCCIYSEQFMSDITEFRVDDTSLMEKSVKKNKNKKRKAIFYLISKKTIFFQLATIDLE